MIDLTIDFNALLEEAKAQYKIYTDTIDPFRKEFDAKKMRFPSEIQAKINAALDKWMIWLNDNINARGLELNCNMLGQPVGISACLTGHRY